MSKLKESFKDLKYLKVCLYVVATVSALFIVYQILSNLFLIIHTIWDFIGNLCTAAAPLLIGLVLAYLLGPVVDLIDRRLMGKLLEKKCGGPIRLEKRKKLSRTLSILLTMLLILAAVVAILYAFTVMIMGRLVFGSLQSMVDGLVQYFMQYERVFRSLISQIPNSGLEEKFQELASASINWISTNFSPNSIIGFISGLGGSMLNIVLGVVVSIYVLKDRDFFLRLWRKTMHVLLPMEQNARLNDTLNEINGVLSLFLRGQLLDSLIIAVLSSVGLTVIGLDFSVFIGCFAGVANVIPYFGPFLGMIPAAAVGLLTGGPGHALIAVVILFIIQQLDGAVISPKIMGQSMGLHPVFILVSVGIGGYYWGIPGMLLATPVAAIIKLFVVRKLDLTD